ncbi:MAG: vanadium-dependent haloperoxidase [Steroidobacter sp.]
MRLDVRRRSRLWFIAALLSLSPTSFAENPVASAEDAFGPHRANLQHTYVQRRPSTPPGGSTLDSVIHWNRIAIDASGLDHTPPAPGETRTFGEHLGPGRASRAMAIVQIAVFEAMNATQGGYRSYVGLPTVHRYFSRYVSSEAAIAQAAHDTLIAMFPSQRAILDAQLSQSLQLVRDPFARQAGALLGAAAARLILRKRAGDGADHAEPHLDTDFVMSDKAGWWRQDPVSQVPIAMGANWGHVRPFVMKKPHQFRVPPPPAMDSAEYTAAYEEVVRLGGDGVITPTQRTAEQTHIGTYWAYDGTPSLCAPSRMYNQIVVHIAQQMNSSAIETARLLALVNVSLADAGIAGWESKYYYQVWRPITAIREADEGTGPSGTGDGNPYTIGDATFMPLGAPASNLTGPNFTPPFPAYPSGHATFGGALFQTLRRFYKTDDVAFTFVSDEYNGATVDNTGQTRPLKPRSFASFSQAEEENARSRIYLGIHWSFDATEGMTQGEQIGDYVFDRVFTPVKR